MIANALRDIVTPRLKKHCERVFYRRESGDKVFPYIVYSFGPINLQDDRNDHVIEINIWDKSVSSSNVLDLGDGILKSFDKENASNEIIVTTFYRDTMKCLDEEDEKLQHVLVRVLSQTYEKQNKDGEVDG